jgi:hypothetical protein
MLDTSRAAGWFQLTFTDLDVAAWPAGIAPFASLGLVDVSLKPKAALEAWDAAFARPLSRVAWPFRYRGPLTVARGAPASARISAVTFRRRWLVDGGR